jgi:hypothetical protein
MQLPSFMGPVRPLPSVARRVAKRGARAGLRAAPPPTLAPAVPMGDRLPGFFVEEQKWDYWCWAAVSSAVARFRNRPILQCEVANRVWGCRRPQCNCCGTQGPTDCNRRQDLGIALEEAEVPAQGRAGVMAEQAIINAITARRVICARIRWPGGLQHFVAIGGWQRSADNVVRFLVRDPERGWSGRELPTTYQALLRNYRDAGGMWNGYFLT